MGILRFVDASYASSIVGGPYDGVCFYIGGNAYHVWPDSDVLARPERYRLPVWVRSDPGSVGAEPDAEACLAALSGYRVPTGSLVAVDTEMSADPGWVQSFVLAVNAGGYPVIDYGSQSVVFGNQNPDGYYWGADWTDVPHLAGGTQMTQYVSFSGYDESEASSALPFWDTKPVPGPPSPVPAWQEDMMQALPTLQSGAQDRAGQVQFVHRVQALVSCIGVVNGLGSVTQLAQDGNFGAGTEAGVKKVQALFQLTQDGIVGPATWAVLVAG